MCMCLSIPDDILKEVGLTGREALIEFACSLFNSDRLSKPAASRLCGLSRGDFENELVKRGLPVLHITEEYMRQEAESLRRLEQLEGGDRAAGPGG